MSDKCFRVGFGRSKATPSYPVPLAGYGNTSTRFHDNVFNDVYTTCVAFTDEDDSTVLLFHNDLSVSRASIFDPMRVQVAEATGVPFERIFVAATHTHSAPDTCSPEPSIQRYLQEFPGWMVAAAKEAMADRKPARMFVGSKFCERLNFGRHYLLSDGSYCGPSFGDPTGKTYVDHAVDVDHTMQVVKFVREGGEDVVLVNWQTHPSRTGGGKRKNLAADVPGVIRDICEGLTGCKLAYFSGASGNVEIKSRIVEENIAADCWSQGALLAGHALAAMVDMQELPTGKVKVVTNIHAGQVDHSEEHKLEKAREVYKFWRETNDSARTEAMGRPHGINSGYHAGAIISRVKQPETLDLTLNAFSIGDLGFALAPYEMFDANGKFIKANSPFDMTFVVTIVNGDDGYIPCKFFYSLDCYERNVCKFKPGIGEELADHFVDMLKQLKEN